MMGRRWAIPEVRGRLLVGDGIDVWSQLLGNKFRSRLVEVHRLVSLLVAS